MGDGMVKVLLGSPVRQKKEVLNLFLRSIKELNRGSFIDIDYYFVDDNVDNESGSLLAHFAEEFPNTVLIKPEESDAYICNEDGHVWHEDLIWKVAGYKNGMIEKALADDYDYLFLVDSDLILHPKTLEQLIYVKKDITSEIFWTKWERDFPKLPQVWMSDQYNLYENLRGESLSADEILKRVQNFIKTLSVPGVYLVGGLGACTLISKKALYAGVNFDEIYNVSFIGEDRHFCIRAAALGFQLFVDTNYPAYHIYRLSDLDGAKKRFA